VFSDRLNCLLSTDVNNQSRVGMLLEFFYQYIISNNSDTNCEYCTVYSSNDTTQNRTSIPNTTIPVSCWYSDASVRAILSIAYVIILPCTVVLCTTKVNITLIYPEIFIISLSE